MKGGLGRGFREAYEIDEVVKRRARMAWGQKPWLSRSEPEKIGLAPEPEPLHQLSRWSRAVSGPSRAVTTLAVPTIAAATCFPHRLVCATTILTGEYVCYEGGREFAR